MGYKLKRENDELIFLIRILSFENKVRIFQYKLKCIPWFDFLPPDRLRPHKNLLHHCLQTPDWSIHNHNTIRNTPLLHILRSLHIIFWMISGKKYPLEHLCECKSLKMIAQIIILSSLIIQTPRVL